MESGHRLSHLVGGTKQDEFRTTLHPDGTRPERGRPVQDDQKDCPDSFVAETERWRRFSGASWREQRRRDRALPLVWPQAARHRPLPIAAGLLRTSSLGLSLVVDGSFSYDVGSQVRTKTITYFSHVDTSSLLDVLSSIDAPSTDVINTLVCLEDSGLVITV